MPWWKKAIDLNLGRRGHCNDTAGKFMTAKANNGKKLEYFTTTNDSRDKIIGSLRRQRHETIYLSRQRQAVVNLRRQNPAVANIIRV